MYQLTCKKYVFSRARLDISNIFKFSGLSNIGQGRHNSRRVAWKSLSPDYWRGIFDARFFCWIWRYLGRSRPNLENWVQVRQPTDKKGTFFRPGIRSTWFLKNQVNPFISPQDSKIGPKTKLKIRKLKTRSRTPVLNLPRNSVWQHCKLELEAKQSTFEIAQSQFCCWSSTALPTRRAGAKPTHTVAFLQAFNAVAPGTMSLSEEWYVQHFSKCFSFCFSKHWWLLFALLFCPFFVFWFRLSRISCRGSTSVMGATEVVFCGLSPRLTQLNFASEGKVWQPASDKVSNVDGLSKSAVWRGNWRDDVMTDTTTGAASAVGACLLDKFVYGPWYQTSVLSVWGQLIFYACVGSWNM